ncbi:EAL domain-containing protein [Haliea sp. E1-2-M8]|uniref:EAL domain-containing protein n=1 Tax=Haliea sp. E1-2-M8 TaxID=3064706 RepID=UPI00271916F1|nr:EAL domain-containing protein [Haliea sp. E1-2-M8]MDO8860257.1 EAL domain-containing protein [Haliea sp. E1-2-M8]
MKDSEGDKLPRSGPIDLASIIEYSPCVAITWCNRPGWPVDFVSANFLQFGYDAADLMSGQLTYRSLIHPDDLARIEPELLARIELGPDQYRERYRLRHGAGHWIWVEGYSWLIREQSGDVIRLGGLLIDVTEQELIAQALQESEHRFRSLFENLERVSVQGYDHEHKVHFWNRASEQLYGYSRSEAQGRTLESLIIPPPMREQVTRSIDAWASGGPAIPPGELVLQDKYGDPVPVYSSHVMTKDSRGRQELYCIDIDLSEQKAYQRQLEQLAHHDALTGLPNRLLLTERLKLSMAQAERRAQRVAVVYLDLDSFKPINDRFGHEVGDRLLAALAERMQRALRGGDTLARLGGDEFVAVLVDIDDVDQSLHVLDRVLAAASDPLQLEGLQLEVSASAGVTFYPQSIEDIDADQLLRQADQAMYQAKLAGKNRFHLFDAEYDRSLRSRHEVCEEVRRGLARGEFVLFYQPKVNMRSGAVIGAEALIRWQHPERGLVPPLGFLPMIARDRVEVELGNWVMREALDQLARWRRQGLNLPVTVNISGFHLQQAGFSAELETLLVKHPELPPGGFGLEVLESSALEDIQQVSRVIGECAALEVPFSLDDFGTGYSSLTYLKQLPARELKIDRSFVRNMLEDPDDLAILEGVLGLARAFSRSVIAEGVETVTHGEVLLHLGCELAQGYGIARPMPAADIPAWLASWAPPAAWRRATLLPREALPWLYASVEHRAWMTGLRSYLEGGRSPQPVLGAERCRISQLLATTPSGSVAENDAFRALLDLHERLHAAANTLVAEFRGQLPEVVASRLQAVDQLSAQLIEQLNQIIRSPPHTGPGP